MFKKFSAALIAASLLAAPAMAAGPTKDAAKTPVTTTTTAPAPTVKPVASVDGKLQAKPSVLNANAKMGRHHHRHHMRRHYRGHKKFGALRTHKHLASKSISKSTVTHIKRG